MRILVVEDEPVLREGLVDLLSGEGHSVEAVADGEAALERGSAPAIQLVVLDLMLPKLDGIEVCRRLRELRADLPILILTAPGLISCGSLGSVTVQPQVLPMRRMSKFNWPALVTT